MGPLTLLAIGVVVTALVYGFARKALLSLTFAIAAIAVFALDLISWSLLFDPRTPSFIPVGIELQLIYARGLVSAPWTWVTFQFIHGSMTHLLLNLMGLIFISPILEERIGSIRWAILFFVGGAFGAGFFILLHAEQIVALVGASAGLLAIFGAFGRLYPRDRVRLFLPLPGMPTFRVIHLVIGFLVLETVLSLVGPAGIAWEAHVGGIAFGFAMAPLVVRLPVGRAKADRLTPVRDLSDLAVTPSLRSILAEIEKADLPEVRDAWIEKFVLASSCPACGGPLRLRLGRLTSPCGWKRRVM